jgi:hypothetical protein
MHCIHLNLVKGLPRSKNWLFCSSWVKFILNSSVTGHQSLAGEGHSWQIWVPYSFECVWLQQAQQIMVNTKMRDKYMMSIPRSRTALCWSFNVVWLPCDRQAANVLASWAPDQNGIWGLKLAIQLPKSQQPGHYKNSTLKNLLCIAENIILNPYNNDTVMFLLIKCPQASVGLRAKKWILVAVTLNPHLCWSNSWAQ